MGDFESISLGSERQLKCQAQKRVKSVHWREQREILEIPVREISSSSAAYQRNINVQCKTNSGKLMSLAPITEANNINNTNFDVFIYFQIDR